jgi:hypothetical protein
MTGAASTTTWCRRTSTRTATDFAAGARHQPICAARLHRPPGTELRCLPEVHRGRLPRRHPHRPEDGQAPRSPSGCAREGTHSGQPHGGLRLHPAGPRAALASAATYAGAVEPGGEHSIGKILTAVLRRPIRHGHQSHRLWRGRHTPVTVTGTGTCPSDQSGSTPAERMCGGTLVTQS